MNSINELRPPLYWNLPDTIDAVNKKSMEERAKVELGLVDSGHKLAEVHGEVIKNYSEINGYFTAAFHFLHAIGKPVQGIAADIGAGTGVAACMISQREEICEVLAIDYSEALVMQVMPRVFDEYGAKKSKIQRIVGDFDHMQLPDNSIDVVVEVDSYHHAQNLGASAREAWRVLKPGGSIIAIDRGWPDDTPEGELNALLDKEFTDEMKRKHGIPIPQHFTRRMFGEHEIRYKDWEESFQQAGFRTVLLYQTHPEGIPGANLLLTHLPALKWSVEAAVRKFMKGQTRLPIYGWAAQKIIFIFMKA